MTNLGGTFPRFRHDVKADRPQLQRAQRFWDILEAAKKPQQDALPPRTQGSRRVNRELEAKRAAVRQSRAEKHAFNEIGAKFRRGLPSAFDARLRSIRDEHADGIARDTKRVAQEAGYLSHLYRRTMGEG